MDEWDIRHACGSLRGSVWFGLGILGGGRRGEVGSTLMDAFCERMRGWADLHIYLYNMYWITVHRRKEKGVGYVVQSLSSVKVMMELQQVIIVRVILREYTF